jgi:peptidoglycan-associated lipoprotein
MKLNRIVFPLVLALAATMTATGCKKGNPKVTPLPGPIAQPPDGGGAGGTLPPVQPYDPDNDPNRLKRGGGNQANRDEFEGMPMDRAAFAAHTIHFSFDSAVIKKTEQANIDAVAAALKSAPANKVLIEGNCDERGTKEYNMALGERRALAAREALVKAGISSDRIRTLSYGKEKPVDPSNNEAAWAKNRRDDFILLLPKATL